MAPQTYLESISTDELSVILRYMSEYPNYKWYDGLDFDDRNLVFAVDGPFSSVIRGRTRKITVGKESLEEEDTLTLSERDTHGTYILQGFGNSIEDVYYTDISPKKCNSYLKTSLIPVIQTYCNRIIRLSLEIDVNRLNPMNKLVEFHSERLQSLQLYFNFTKFFQLNLPILPKLSKLHVEGEILPHLSNVLHSIRNTLECIELCAKHAAWKSIIADLHTCPNLKIVKLEGQVPGEPYASLLESLGSKIECANMNEMHVNLCERVLISCANMTCNLFVNAKDVKRISVLGSRVRKLHIEHREDTHNIDGIEAALEQCTDITQVGLVLIENIGVLNQILTGIKSYPDAIHLKHSRASFTDEHLRTLRCCTRNLKSLFLCFRLYEHFDGILNLVQDNPCLESVQVIDGRMNNANQAIENATKLMRALRRHEKLRYLRICLDWSVMESDAFIIATEFVPFRHRRVRVTINNLDFN